MRSISTELVEHPYGILGAEMKRDPFLVLAILAFSFFLLVEVGTVDLGHEFTWFGRLSQSHSTLLRYALLAVFISSTALTALRHFTRKPSAQN